MLRVHVYILTHTCTIVRLYDCMVVYEYILMIVMYKYTIVSLYAWCMMPAWLYGCMHGCHGCNIGYTSVCLYPCILVVVNACTGMKEHAPRMCVPFAHTHMLVYINVYVWLHECLCLYRHHYGTTMYRHACIAAYCGPTSVPSAASSSLLWASRSKPQGKYCWTRNRYLCACICIYIYMPTRMRCMRACID